MGSCKFYLCTVDHVMVSHVTMQSCIFLYISWHDSYSGHYHLLAVQFWSSFPVWGISPMVSHDGKHSLPLTADAERSCLLSLRSLRLDTFLQMGILSSYRDCKTHWPAAAVEAEGMQGLVLVQVLLPETHWLDGSPPLTQSSVVLGSDTQCLTFSGWISRSPFYPVWSENLLGMQNLALPQIYWVKVLKFSRVSCT